eukprot:m.378792 g.378792  ORF g.378792 m.378792 type:complete len:87 (-) comp56205_c0_seq3:57-317(-)
MPLTAMLSHITKTVPLLKSLHIDPETFTSFAMAVEAGYGQYPSIPYHTNVHAADVVHSTFLMISHPAFKGVFSDLEVMCVINLRPA